MAGPGGGRRVPGRPRTRIWSGAPPPRLGSGRLAARGGLLGPRRLLGRLGRRLLLRRRGAAGRGPLGGRAATCALGARLGGRLDAGVERLHQVDDLGGRLRRLLDHDLVALALLLDQRLDLFAVRVVVALGVPVGLHRLDEQLRHGELAVADLVRVGQLGQLVARAADLVGEVHGVQGQRVLFGPDSHEVLLVAHHHGGDADTVGVGHRLAQQRIGLVGAGTFGGEVVTRPEIDRVDVGLEDEVGDLDLPGLLRLGTLELLLAQDDVLATTEIEAADDVVVSDLLARPLVDLLVADAVGGPLLELVEVDALVRRRRVQADGDVHQPEAEGALPNGAWHVQQITSPDQVHHLVTAIRHTEAMTSSVPEGFGSALLSGLAELGPVDPFSGDLSLELGVSVWLRMSGTPLLEARRRLLHIRELIIEVCGLDPATEPVPLVGRSPRNDVLNLVGYVGDLLRRAASMSGRTVHGVARLVIEELPPDAQEAALGA